MESYRKGDLTEAVVLVELKRRNISVSVPFGDNERYDVVVEAASGDIFRVQIKTGWIDDGVVHFHGKSQHTNSQGNTYEYYEGDVDYFLVYVHELDSMFWIGEWEFGEAMTLRVDEPEQVHHTINWASDYEFDERWPPREDETTTIGGKPVVRRIAPKLESLDVPTARYLGDGPVAFLLETDGQRYRLAAQTGWYQDGCVDVNAGDSVDRTAIDYFVVYCDELDQAYLVGAEEFDRSISLRVEDGVQHRSTINWAAEYELTARVAGLA